MHTSILKKCVEELKKESPKIDYILGMLETIIELSNEPIKTNIRDFNLPNNEGGRENQPKERMVEGGRGEFQKGEKDTPIPDFLKPGPIGKITQS